VATSRTPLKPRHSTPRGSSVANAQYAQHSIKFQVERPGFSPPRRPLMNPVRTSGLVAPYQYHNGWIQGQDVPSANIAVASSPSELVDASQSAQDETAGSTRSSDVKRKHICDYPGCEKSFTTSGHLARHARTHTGEKKFQCTFAGCQSRFSRHDNMLQHYRSHLGRNSRRRKTGPALGADDPQASTSTATRNASRPKSASRSLGSRSAPAASVSPLTMPSLSSGTISPISTTVPLPFGGGPSSSVQPQSIDMRQPYVHSSPAAPPRLSPHGITHQLCGSYAVAEQSAAFGDQSGTGRQSSPFVFGSIKLHYRAHHANFDVLLFSVR